MKKFTLLQRMTLVFIALLMTSCLLSGVMQVRTSNQYSQAVIQQLSANLAEQIANNNPLLSQNGLDAQAVHTLFNQLMAVNPSVELYLLDKDGTIISHAAPAGRVQHSSVSLSPIRDFLGGATFPVYGDNPRQPDVPQVFSVAPLRVGNELKGYVYIILLGDQYTQLASHAQFQSAVYQALRSMVIVLLLSLLAGWLAFRWLTRPLRQLTAQIATLDKGGMLAIRQLAASPIDQDNSQDEITLLRLAFVSLSRRIDKQWQSLMEQDRLRRKFIANISHDLRTPLTSLHGYLETLEMKAAQLTPKDRQRYLHIAIAQSRKVGLLAQELFELARLEYGVVKPQKEPFSLGDVLQDVLAKFELAAETRQQTLWADISPDAPLVQADLAMIERVLTNLLDNAIRHSPSGGTIEIRLWQQQQQLFVQLQDSGTGVAPQLKEGLFVRPSVMNSDSHRSGGLGLMIVKRILQLHDGDIVLIDKPGGACFQFSLPL
jgi:signal transduction histidine kinase